MRGRTELCGSGRRGQNRPWVNERQSSGDSRPWQRWRGDVDKMGTQRPWRECTFGGYSDKTKARE